MNDGRSAGPGRNGTATAVGGGSGMILETVVSPFHCLYQDALEFHKQSHLRRPRSESEASRLARAALVLYVAAAESLVHQAAAELGRPELARLVGDPSATVALARRLAAAAGVGGGARRTARATRKRGPGRSSRSCWPCGSDWSYPGPEADRRAYDRLGAGADDCGEFEPLEPHEVPPGLDLPPERLVYPRTGLPRDPYALRPHHLDTARGVLDAAIAALDRLLDGALTRNGRHRREPVRVVFPG